jgi:hypothetical protein
MRVPRLSLLFVACFLLARSVCAQEKLPDNLLLGTAQHGSVFAVAPLTGPDRVSDPTVTVYRGPLAAEAGKPDAGKRYAFKQWVLGGCPYRLRVAHDCFWGSGSVASGAYGHELLRVPLDDLPLFDPDTKDVKALWVKKYGPDYASTTGHSWQLGPAQWAAIDHIRRTEDGVYNGGDFPRPVYDMHFDAWPADSNAVLLFVQEENGMRVWRGVGNRPGTKGRALWGDWEKDFERFDIPFDDGFAVFVKGGDYSFVTEKGKVYLGSKPAKGEARKVEAVWDNKRQPVRAVISDADGDKHYCFVEPKFGDKEDEERVYFELAAKPDPRRYQRKATDIKADKPLKAVLEFAQVLVNDKLLKPE